MPPAAADQFFTSRASSLMHSNNNNNSNTNTNNNNNNTGSKSTTPTTLKNLINYNNNNNSSCLQESRTSSVKSSTVGCGSCLRYQREQDQLRQPNKEGEEDTNNFDLVQGDHRSMTAVTSDGEHQNPLSGSYHSSKAKSNTHRTPCTNVVNGLSHSYYDCCINVHVSALLDHWLDWPSNHCPPSKSPERNSYAGSNPHPKKFHTKDGASHVGSMLGQFSNGDSSRHFLSTLISTQQLLCKTVSSSSSTPTFCVGPTDSCQECEGCKLLIILSNPSSEEGISDSFILEQLASHIGEHIEDQTETLSNIRKYFAAKGCDIINYQDSKGKTLLHYSITAGDVINGEEIVRQLLEAGADPNIPDNNGETPLLTTRNLFERHMYSNAHAIIRVLIYDYPSSLGNVNHRKVNVNACNESGGSLLSYAVQSGDGTADVTRLLLNSGASVWQDDSINSLDSKAKTTQKRSPEGLNCSQARNVINDSAFKWYLCSLMRGDTDIETSKQTLYMLCTAMESQQHPISMGQHIDRTMVELGVAPKINGPLFKKLRAEIAPFIAKPQSLRFICIKSIRKSIGKRQRQQMIQVSSPPTKRLRTNSSSSSSSSLPLQPSSSYLLRNRGNNNPARCTAVKSTISGTTISNCKLKLPHKLQQFVCLEEMVVPN